MSTIIWQWIERITYVLISVFVIAWMTVAVSSSFFVNREEDTLNVAVWLQAIFAGIGICSAIFIASANTNSRRNELENRKKVVREALGLVAARAHELSRYMIKSFEDGEFVCSESLFEQRTKVLEADLRMLQQINPIDLPSKEDVTEFWLLRTWLEESAKLARAYVADPGIDSQLNICFAGVHATEQLKDVLGRIEAL